MYAVQCIVQGLMVPSKGVLWNTVGTAKEQYFCCVNGYASRPFRLILFIPAKIGIIH